MGRERKNERARESNGWFQARNLRSKLGQETTIYVDNLPMDMDAEWLAQLFSKYGEVLDAFIPHKMSRRFNTKFGFVRFRYKKEAWDAIYDLNGLVIRENKMLVKIASFGASDRNFKFGQSRSRKEEDKPLGLISKGVGLQKWESSKWVNKPREWNKGSKTYSEVVKDIANSDQSIKLDEIGNEWLYRSAVAKLSPLKSMALIQDHLSNLRYFDIQVRPMGGDHLIITFPTIIACDSVFNNGEFAWIKDWFVEIQKWNKYSVIPPSRLVWLNCYGVPLHLWNAGTFSKLGQKWGRVVQISNDTLKEISFSVGKVLISTEIMDTINDVVLVENKGVKFNIRICEEQIVVNTIVRTDCNCKGCRKEKLNGGEDDMDNDMARQEQVADNGSNHVDNVAETLFEGEDTVEAINEMVETPEVQSLQVMNKCNLRGSMCCSLGQQFSPLVRDGINTGEGLGNIHVHANFTDILFGHNLRKSIPTPVPTTFSRPANVVGQENSNQLEETIECTSVAGSGKVVKPKARRKNKTIEEILNLTKPSSERKRKKQKCVVYRSAAAVMALSVSTDGIVNRNRILLNEAQAARALDNLFGNNFKGSEEEVVSKILQMEIQDAERAELQAKMPAN